MDKNFTHALLLAEDVQQADLVLDFLYADYHRRPVKNKEAKPYINRRQRIANQVWERFTENNHLNHSGSRIGLQSDLRTTMA
ncbi:MAG: hypothetical protein J5589_01985 [Firmicutes bacterium]|nr:hypothetical protein [Bacillota bacterium]